MLIEIFNSNTYDELCISSPNEIPKRVPRTVITETDRDTIDKYKIVRDFLINALDKPTYNLKNSGQYMLAIEKHIKTSSEKVWLTSTISSDFFNEEFDFKFDLINGDPEWRTIHGKVTINYFNDIVAYSRDNFAGPKVTNDSTTTTLQQRVVTDSTSTSGKRLEYIEVPTAYPPGEGSDTVNPIDLSPDSFSVDNDSGTIGVTCPEMEIGVVESNTLEINEKRQAAQDAFMKVINRKISSATKRHKAERN